MSRPAALTRVAVDDRADVGPLAVDLKMHVELRGRFTAAEAVGALGRDDDQILGLHVALGQPGRAHEDAAVVEP